MRRVFSEVHSSESLHTVSWHRADASVDWQPVSGELSVDPGRVTEPMGGLRIRVDPSAMVKSDCDPPKNQEYCRVRLGDDHWVLTFESIQRRSANELLCPVPAAIAGLYQDSSVLLSAQAGFIYLDSKVGYFFGWNQGDPCWRCFSLERPQTSGCIRQAFALWSSGFMEVPGWLYVYAENELDYADLDLPFEWSHWKGFHPLHLGAVRAWQQLELENGSVPGGFTNARRWIGWGTGVLALILIAGLWNGFTHARAWVDETGVNRLSYNANIATVFNLAELRNEAVIARHIRFQRVQEFLQMAARIETFWPENQWTLRTNKDSGIEFSLREDAGLITAGSEPMDWLDGRILDFESSLSELADSSGWRISHAWDGGTVLRLHALLDDALSGSGSSRAAARLGESINQLSVVDPRQLRQNVAGLRGKLRQAGVELASDPHFGWGNWLATGFSNSNGPKVQTGQLVLTERLVGLLCDVPELRAVEIRWLQTGMSFEQLQVAATIRSRQLAPFLLRLAVLDLALDIAELELNFVHSDEIKAIASLRWITDKADTHSVDTETALTLPIPPWADSDQYESESPLEPDIPEIVAEIHWSGALTLKGTFTDGNGALAYILFDVENKNWLTLLEGHLCEATGAVASEVPALQEMSQPRAVVLHWPQTGRSEVLGADSNPVRIAHAFIRESSGEASIRICGVPWESNGVEWCWYSNQSSNRALEWRQK